MTIEELVGAGFCLVATWQRDESGQGVYKEKKRKSFQRSQGFILLLSSEDQWCATT
jgi:hypothetical protein